MPSVAPIKVPIVGTDQYTKEFNKMVKTAKKMGQSITSMGRTMTASITLPVLGIGAASLKMSRDINKAMANVGTLIPGQAEKLRSFKRDVMELGIEFGTSSTVLTDGLYQVISAVGDTADTMSILKISAMAAKAGVSETKDAVNLLTKVSTAYGNTSAGMIQNVSDLSFLAVKLGVTTFPELAASMGNIASTAQAMGVGVNELFADTAALTKVLGDTSQAATAMDAVMGELMRGGGDLDKQFRKLNVKSGAELIQRFGGLTGALEALKGSAGGTEIKLKQLFGRKEAMKGAGLLTGSLAQSALEIRKQMEQASGSTMQAFKEQAEGIDKAGFQYDQMVQRVKKLLVIIGDRLVPILGKLMDKIEPLIEEFSNMSDESIISAIKFAGLAAAIGPVLIVVGKTTVAVSSLIGILGNGKLVSALTNASDAFSKAASSAGDLASPIAVISAALLGWKVGSIIHSQLVEPLEKSLWNIKRINEEFGVSKERSKDPNRSKGLLMDDIRLAERKLKSMRDGFKFTAEELKILTSKNIKDFSSDEIRDLTRKKKLIRFEAFSAYREQQDMLDYIGGLKSRVDKMPKPKTQSVMDTVDMSTWNPQSSKYALQTISPEAIKEIQKGAGVDGTIHIMFDNMPAGMRPKVKKERGGKLDVRAPRGPIMEGSF